MAGRKLESEFSRMLDEWQALGRSLAGITRRLAIETLADALPGTQALEVCGGYDEDLLRILRVRRAFARDGTALFDAEQGHDDRRIEEVVDEVNTEYLDLLIDLAGDAYMGMSIIEAE